MEKTKANPVQHLILILISLCLLTSCNKAEDNGPLSLAKRNQNCLEGKIKGQFLIQYTNGQHELIAASSNQDFLNKIKAQPFVDNLKQRNLEISGVDYNFRVFAHSRTLNASPPTTDANLGPRMLNAPFLWKKGFLGAGAHIALIDSGYDIQHPLLQNSAQELGAQGWDYINNKALEGDLDSHGTAVGSIIAAAHTNSFQFSMAPESQILPIAALKPSEEGEDEATDVSGDSNSVLSAIDLAIKSKVDFINASWAGDNCSKFIREKVHLATQAGIIVVTSAGNENRDLGKQPIFPGSFPFSLIATVGALNPDFSRQSHSNYGTPVDFFALGSKVVVAAPQSFLDTAAGTSVATPFITGALALLKSAFPQAQPEQLLNALEGSKNSKKIPDLERAFYRLNQN